MKKNILISTGGSGGHVVPAEILRDHFKEKFKVFISSDLRGLRYLSKEKNDYIIFNTPRLTVDFLILFKFFKIIYLIIKSYLYLKNNKIRKVFSTGGYMSLPVCLGAYLLGIEIYLLEPNIVLGRANRFFLKFCKKIFSQTKDLKNLPKKYKDKIQIITPLVRKEFYEKKKIENEKKKFCFLVVGGSQGAQIFEKTVQNVIINLSKNYEIQIIQQTKSDNIVNLKNVYEKENIKNSVFDFEQNFQNLINQCDFCITRGGASTLAELSIMNKPFLVVPLLSSKDNHQFENANFYKNLNCCWLISQKDFDSESLEILLNNILKNRTEYDVKKENLKKLNFQNTWNNINQKLLKIIDEN
tara:strand:- start:7672 stop:8739 length:1068 start_codon:yes stop_codon:yes gene_type:complete